MKLSKKSIAGILEKEKKINPKIHYISDITKANDFAEVVRIFNGRSIMAYGIEEIHEITAESNSLVIGLETLDNGKILAMERALRIAKKRKVPVFFRINEGGKVGDDQQRCNQPVQYQQYDQPYATFSNHSGSLLPFI